MERRSPTKLSTRLLVLLCMMGLGLIIATLALAVVRKQDMMLILTVQDVLVFILPAVAAMAILYRRPFHAMALDRAPHGKPCSSCWRSISSRYRP